MATLLDYPAPDYGCTEYEVWGNRTLADDSGKIVQVRGVRTTPLWRVPLSWTRPAADLATFLTALRALKGGQTDCYVYTPSYGTWWDGAAAGTGDGATLLFPFGGRDVQASPAPVVTVGGVVESAANYTIEVAPGDSLARWRVSFLAGHAPGAAAAVTVSFSGRRLLLARIASAGIPHGVPDYQQMQLQLEFRGDEV